MVVTRKFEVRNSCSSRQRRRETPRSRSGMAQGEMTLSAEMMELFDDVIPRRIITRQSLASRALEVGKGHWGTWAKRYYSLLWEAESRLATTCNASLVP